MTTAVAEADRLGVGLARVHGWCNFLGGLWPLVHRRSFEAIFGPKKDRWLMYTVAGLLVGNGAVQLRSEGTVEGTHAARRVGVATAATLLTVDLVYVPAGRIPKTYLLDAAMEGALLAAWAWHARTRGP
ncbi:hypothetical protein M1M07_02680 [Rhodococcus sp. HM1]|uniref:hypothetical protein n=1 Tax=unclassified Rhodococcus (in: high G+C Gram-positive bacteria) TaxID=192944 RepID=UPI0018CEFF8F|nr:MULTISPECIES: hypothetical protein [unclassified Rhodococcus (in: high G+C Gram-positive bacteria)]MBH0121631.1 hypothetical protein [Rhodococcus sp. CX]MCK8670023.1 hypothetical protein [Rhodococcus sp. HM1]